MKTNLDKRLIDLLEKRGISGDIQDFLYPDLKMMHNPFDLNGMSEATKLIKAAIEHNKKILIFGDYDCDGISAATILMLYFREKNANVSAFIPSRFDDGYGLNMSTIAELIASGKPDLVITVDLGVTAVNEVEELKKNGIDVIITDHHEPMDTLPNCIVVDPKIPNQKYPFNGLCGAGVAFKLIEALESRDYAAQYLDIAAIATIGDIVPLVDENRIISKLGLAKINSGDTKESIKCFIEKLGLSNITAEDVSFRIVPRLNASGRMTNGKKVLDCLIETDSSKLEILYEALAEDNNLRLAQIELGNQAILEQLKNTDLNSSPAILIVGDFHQGVLGILASRVCHDYNKPAIIFSRTEEGTIKGSGRSTSDINIHSILGSLAHLFIRFGGHKMAIGIELKEENFEEFKNLFNQQINQLELSYKSDNYDYDIEITESDLNLKFAKQINMLEPFGCANSKPIFMLKTGNLQTEQMSGKSYKHYRICTKTGKQIVAFNASKYIELLKNNCNKQLLLEVKVKEYKGKQFTSCKFIDVKYDDDKFVFNNKLVCASSIVNKYNSLNNLDKPNVKHLSLNKLILKCEEFTKQKFGTIIVCQTNKHLQELLQNQTIRNNYMVSATIPADKSNCILVKSAGLTEVECGYSNFIFFRSALRDEHQFLPANCNVFDLNLFAEHNLVSTERTLLGLCYNVIKKHANIIFANDIFEWAEKMCLLEKSISVAQIIFAAYVFADLKLLEFVGGENTFIRVIGNKKCELSDSRFYKEFLQGIDKK